MVELDPLASVVLLIGVTTGATVALLLLLRLLKEGRIHRVLRAREEETTGRDRAHTALATTEAIARELLAKGFESVKANRLLESAQEALYEGRLGEAEAVALEARDALQDLLSEDRVAAEVDAVLDEISEEKPALDRKYPKHFLEAKFLLGVVQERVEETKKSTKKGKRLRKLVNEAQAAFDEEAYTEALGLASRCRRLLEEGKERAKEAPTAALERLPLAELEEERSCPECGVPVAPHDAFCGQCGTVLQGATCAECGAELEETDNFCRRCGTPREEMTAAR